MTECALKVIETTTLPLSPDTNTIYRLVPNNFDLAFYNERTDRNIGWITRDEQVMLKDCVVGIAGCGGMGGLVASTLLRAGVGEIRIADCETFDISNINRQFGARRDTLDKSKVFTTAQMLRDITDDSTLVVYPQGISEETVDHFLDGCGVVCDEIEVLAIDARILLHQRGRKSGVPLFNCNTVGFSTNLFLYTPESMTMEEATGLSYTQSQELRTQAQAGDEEALSVIADAMMRAVVPTLPEYSPDTDGANREYFFHRLLKEKKAPIIATNPPMASGFVANHVLLYLLRNSGVKREVVQVPQMPGYLHFDAALMKAIVSTIQWW